MAGGTVIAIGTLVIQVTHPVGIKVDGLGTGWSGDRMVRGQDGPGTGWSGDRMVRGQVGLEQKLPSIACS